MNTLDLIKQLQSLKQRMPIEIECPNGLLVEPKIKMRREHLDNPKSPVVAYVIDWKP
jgi:hypothetical protein